MEYLHGGDIYTDNKIRLDFSVNTNPFGMPEAVKKAAAASEQSWERYPDSLSRTIRQSLAKYYGDGIKPEHLICGNGASDLFYTLVFALRPGKALVPSPSFAEYETALSAAGCKTERFYPGEEYGFALDGGERDFLSRVADSSGTDMVIIGNPGNPTGMAADNGWIDRLAGLCREKGIFLVVDECFNWFLKDRAKFSVIPLIKKRPEEYGHVMAVNAFTKVYAMAGLRFGYALCTDQMILERTECCRQPWSVSAPAEAAALAAVREAAVNGGWIDRTVAAVERERQFLADGLERMGFTVFPSMVNYILFKSGNCFDYKEFCRDRGILIRSCENFDGLDKRYYRVSVRLHEENKALLECMKAAGGKG